MKYLEFQPIIKAILLLMLSLFLMTDSLIPDHTTAQESLTTAFIHVNVIPMDGERILENYTVVVQNGLITEVGPSDEVVVPDGAQVINGEGKYLMPGLADMHIHTYPFDSPAHLILYLTYGVTTVRNLGVPLQQMNWPEQIQVGEIVGPTIYQSGPNVVGFGYNTAVSPLQIFGMRATLWVIVFLPLILVFLLIWFGLRLFGRRGLSGDFRRRAGLPWLGIAVVVAILVVVFKLIPIQLVAQVFVPSFQMYAETSRDARWIVAQQQQAGADFIKPYERMPAAAHLATIEAAEERGLYTVGHLPVENPNEFALEEIFAAGLDEVAHTHEYQEYFLIGYDQDIPQIEERLYDIDMGLIEETADLAAKYEVGVTANLVAIEMTMLRIEGDRAAWYARPEYATLPPKMVEAWVERDRSDNWGEGEREQLLAYIRTRVQPWEWAFTKALQERGLPVVLGTDVSVEGIVPGYSAHHELELLVKAGFTPFEALSAGTRTAAEVAGRMGVESNWGTLEPGNRGDLILLSANPLEDITNSRTIEGVMVRGQWFSQAELDGMVDAYVATYPVDN